MTEVAKEIMGRFPVDQLAFIFASGFFLVVAFPFDVSSLDFSRGLPSTVALLDCVRWNFAPFVGIKYLGAEFPSGLVKMILMSVPTGMFFFFFYDVFRDVNRFVMQRVVVRYITHRSVSDLMGIQTNRAPKEFYDWFVERRIGKFWDFMGVMSLASLGLFYSCEFFLLIVILSWIARACTFEAVIAASVLCAFLYFAVKVYDRRYNDSFASLLRVYFIERQAT